MNEEQNQYQDSIINKSQLENNLKDLLERILQNAEKFIDTREEFNQIEVELIDYENLSHLIGIIKAVTEEKYEKLEQTMIKYDVEIRNHIRIEQQLKLYVESIQTKLDESEINRAELLNTTKQLISNLKKENQTYHEVQEKLKNEIYYLKQIINGLEKENKRKSLDLSQREQQIQNSKAFQQPIPQPFQLENQKIEKSFSEYKGNLKQQLEKVIKIDNNEIPIKSQQYNIINYCNSMNKVIQKIIQQKEGYRFYGQKLRNKNNSLSNIKDVIQNISVQDRKRGLGSQTISKNSSLQNSQVIKNKKNENLNKCKSSRRANIGQKLIMMESQIKLTC